MAITKQITAPPPAPQRSDPDTFADRADAFVSWLETFRNDLADWTGQLNSTQNQINAIQNVKVYSDSDTYNFPDLVVASDGHLYRCLGDNVQGDNPVGSTTGNWVKITSAVVSNLGASSEPTVTDDVTKGYHIGSLWITDTGRVFICVDATEGKAKWRSFFDASSLISIDIVGDDYVNSGQQNKWHVSVKHKLNLALLQAKVIYSDGNEETIDLTSNSFDVVHTFTGSEGDSAYFAVAVVDEWGFISEYVRKDLTVTVNKRPVINSITWSESKLYEGNTYTVTIDATDADNDTLVYSVSCSDENVNISQVDTNVFQVSLPVYGKQTSVSFTYTVSDGKLGGQISQTEQKIIYPDSWLVKIDISGFSYTTFDSIIHESGNYYAICSGDITDYDVLVKFGNDFSFQNALNYQTVSGGIPESLRFNSLHFVDGYVYCFGTLLDGGSGNRYAFCCKVSDDLNTVIAQKYCSNDERFAKSVYDSQNGRFIVRGKYDLKQIFVFDTDLNLVSAFQIGDKNLNDLSLKDDYLYIVAYDASDNSYVYILDKNDFSVVDGLAVYNMPVVLGNIVFVNDGFYLRGYGSGGEGYLVFVSYALDKVSVYVIDNLGSFYDLHQVGDYLVVSYSSYTLNENQYLLCLQKDDLLMEKMVGIFSTADVDNPKIYMYGISQIGEKLFARAYVVDKGDILVALPSDMSFPETTFAVGDDVYVVGVKEFPQPRGLLVTGVNFAKFTPSKTAISPTFTDSSFSILHPDVTVTKKRL